MKKVDISVVMAEYNTPINDLIESIQSVVDQTYKNFEFIIVDDGTKNDLMTIVDSFDDHRIKVIKNPSNMGFVYSLNNGIKHAQGKYIVRMDTDDISMPDRIEKLYNYIVSHPEYAVVGTKAVEFSDKIEYGVLGEAGEKSRQSIMRGNIIIHASAIIDKKALEAIGYYKEYTRAEDLVLWCELLLKHYRLYTIDEVLYRYRVNVNDYSKRKIKYRMGEIKARMHFYPKLGAGLIDYLFIIKSILSGLLPIRFVQIYRNMFVLHKNTGERKER